MATTTSVSVTELTPIGGNTLDGTKIGYITAGAKAAQNDKWDVKNVKAIIKAFPTVDATGAFETHTISGSEITLTSATTGACSAFVIYR